MNIEKAALKARNYLIGSQNDMPQDTLGVTHYIEAWDIFWKAVKEPSMSDKFKGLLSEEDKLNALCIAHNFYVAHYCDCVKWGDRRFGWLFNQMIGDQQKIVDGSAREMPPDSLIELVENNLKLQKALDQAKEDIDRWKIGKCHHNA